MKKLLILTLVLGLASASYGAYSSGDFALELEGGTLTVVGLNAVTLNVGVYNTDTGTQVGTPAVKLSDGMGGNAAGALSAISVYNTGGWDGFDFTTGPDPQNLDVVDIMDWFTVPYSGNVGDSLTIYDYSVTGSPTTTLSVTPEPMTIALLGLGGLFLRRRK